jgi:hypothetical protein
VELSVLGLKQAYKAVRQLQLLAVKRQTHLFLPSSFGRCEG